MRVCVRIFIKRLTGLRDGVEIQSLSERTRASKPNAAPIVHIEQVVTLLCVSPADNQAEKTERALSFGKACENSGDGAAAQLK